MQAPGRFNEVPEKVPKVPEKVLGIFGAEPGQVQQGSGADFGVALVQSQVRFNRVTKKVLGGQVQMGSGEGSGKGSGEEGSGECLGSFGAEAGQVQQGSGEGSGKSSGEEGSGECLGSFGAEAGQVQQGSGKGSGEEGSGECLGSFGAEAGQVQQGSGEGSGKGSGEEGSGECLGSFGAEAGQVQQRSGEGTQNVPGEGLGGCREGPGEGFGNLWSGEGSGEVCFSSFCFSGMCADGIITWMLLEQLCFPDSFLRFVLIMPILTTLLPRCCLLERFVKIKRCGYRGYHRSIICSKAEVVTTGPHNPDSVMLSCNGHFYPPRKPREPCVFFGSALGCWKGNSCNFRHVMVNQTGTRPTKASREQVKEELRRRGWAGHDMSGRSRLIWSMMSMGDSG